MSKTSTPRSKRLFTIPVTTVKPETSDLSLRVNLLRTIAIGVLNFESSGVLSLWDYEDSAGNLIRSDGTYSLAQLESFRGTPNSTNA